MRDKDYYFYFNNMFPYTLGVYIQLRRPFFVKKWKYVSRPNKDFTIHLFPIHFYFNYNYFTRFRKYRIYKKAGCINMWLGYLYSDINFTNKKCYCDYCN